MDSYARTFIHLLISRHNMPNKHADGWDWDLSEIVNPLLDLQEASEATGLGLQAQDKDRWLTLTRFRRDERFLTLLFVYSSSRISDPDLQDLETLAIRRIEKPAGTAWAYSGHLIVDLDPNVQGLHHAILEQVTGVTRGRVAKFLNHHAKKIARDEEWRDQNDRRIWPKLEFEVEPGEQLLRALQEGKLAGIDFVNTRAALFSGAGALRLETKESVLKMSVPRDVVARRAFFDQDQPALLDRAIRLGRKQDYDLLRVRLSKSTNSTLPSEVAVSTADDNARETLFAKRTWRQFAEPLSNAHPDINEDIVSHATTELRSKATSS